MNIYVSGVNYKTTPIEIRETLSFDPDAQKQVLDSISKLSGVDECVFLSTCNRTELYIYSKGENFDVSKAEKALCQIKGKPIYDYKKYFYVYSGVKAVKHLFKVTSGLDSLVLGEDQILGQVKGAYDLSHELGTSSNILNTLFRDAITAAKKIKTNTQLSKSSVSISTLAVKLVEEIFEGNLEDKCVLVIGAGKIGTIALKNLCSKGVGKIYVTNRSHGKADDLSKVYNSVYPVDYLNRYSVVNECDVVISSTSSPHYTITRDMLEKSVNVKKNRVFIDLAVPRDIDEAINEIPGISYYNIDHLKSVVDENMDRRIMEASKAEQIIEEFVDEFERWYEFRNVLPVVKEVQKYAENVINEKINSTLSSLKSSSEEDKEKVRISIASTVNEIMNTLIYSVRKSGCKEDMQAYFRCLSEVIKEN